jgi:hypothetical protein
LLKCQSSCIVGSLEASAYDRKPSFSEQGSPVLVIDKIRIRLNERVQCNVRRARGQQIGEVIDGNAGARAQRAYILIRIH